MIYPVICYHDESYRTCNTATNKGFHQAIQWFHQTAAKLPPLIQYRSFSTPEAGVYGALLTTAEPFADRDGRDTPTKIMLILDSAATAELMEDPRRIPALAAYMRERLTDPDNAQELTELPELSPWMEKQEDAETLGDETGLIRHAVRSNAEGKHKVCYVTDRWETLAAAMMEMPLAQRCCIAFSIGWRKTENADFFDVIVNGGEEAAAVHPRTKRVWTKDCHGPVREASSGKQEKLFVRPPRRVEYRPDYGKCHVAVISDRSEYSESSHRPKRPQRIRVGRILRTLLLMALAAVFLVMNGSVFLSELGHVYIHLGLDGNDLINAVLLVVFGYLLGKLCCQVEVDEE